MNPNRSIRSAAPAVRLVAALGFVALAALFGVLAPQGPASAHASLIGSDPAAEESIAALPAEVTLTFSQEMRGPAYVLVTGPDGEHAEGEASIDVEEVTQAVNPGPAGDYTLSYRVVSEDGHPVSGTVAFTVTEGTGEASGDGEDATIEESDGGAEASASSTSGDDEGSW